MTDVSQILVRTQLEYCIRAWNPHLKEDIEKREKECKEELQQIWGFNDVRH